MFLNGAFLCGAIGKVLFSIFINCVTFKWEGVKNLLKLTLAFYLVSFAFGGTVFAMMYFTNLPEILGLLIQNGEVYINIPIGFLILAVVSAYLSVWIYTKICKKSYLNQSLIKEVIVTLGTKMAKLNALIDTGNELKDPLTQKSVLIVELNAIRTLLPIEIVKIYEGGKLDDLGCISRALQECQNFNFRLIPFSALEHKGIMIGFKPDTIETDGFKEDLIVAICKQKLSNIGDYNALLGKEC